MSAASSSEIVLASQGAQCTISTHGAQVLSFVPAPAAGRTEGGGDAGAGGGDVFFMSALEYTDKRKAKRGGVPIIFPQFSTFGSLSKNGFARNLPFTVTEIGQRPAPDGSTETNRCVLSLTHSEMDEAMRAGFEREFELKVSVQIVESGSALRMDATVVNLGASSMSFSFCFHNYFRVANIRECGISGLESSSYWNALKKSPASVISGVPSSADLMAPPPPQLSKKKGRDELSARGKTSASNPHVTRIVYETDRIYAQVNDDVIVHDERDHRKIAIMRENLPDVVVWNPDMDTAKTISDLGDSEYTQFVCVEPGAILTPVESLDAGGSWRCAQTLHVKHDTET